MTNTEPILLARGSVPSEKELRGVVFKLCSGVLLMKDRKKSKRECPADIEKLRMRLEEAEETLLAIRRGEVDALIVSTPGGDEVYTLRGAETPYRIFVETMAEGAATISPEGLILYCNDRFAEMIRVPTSAVIGSSLYTFIPDEHVSAFRAAFQKEGAETSKIEIQFRAGEKILIPVHLSIILLKKSETPTFCVVAMELTERKRLEEQVRQSQKMEAIGTLTGGIAHDLNNILGPIIINSELALMDLPKESSLRNNLDLILQSGMRGRDLVRQMLLFSRKSQNIQEVVSLASVLKETFHLLRSSIPTTIDMTLRLEAESDSVWADASQMQQVIMNLCTNAAYAMRNSIGSLEISLQDIAFGSSDLPAPDMKPGRYLVLSVKDTGCGLDEHVRERLFEPFFTTKPPGEGTGLGLSVIYGIVKSHQGNITVESEPGRGTIFRVYLPKMKTQT